MLVCFVSLMHILWGTLLLINNAPIVTAATEVLRHIVPEPNLRAIIYIVVGLLPMVLIKWPGSGWGLASVFPQQILLMFSGISALIAISSGHYADGTVRPAIFITMDQGIYIVLSVLHAFESLDRYHERRPHERTERER